MRKYGMFLTCTFLSGFYVLPTYLNGRFDKMYLNRSFSFDRASDLVI